MAWLPGTAAADQAVSGSEPLEEVIVTATLRPTASIRVPSSATVLTSASLASGTTQHLADVMHRIPNLNWAGGTSRPRYFQIRGVGELDQWQGAPNPSVGFLLDDIDLSGVGMPATLFDVKQIEVLRGPQGTTYGANGLAGLIKVSTSDPTPEAELASRAMIGSDGAWSAGIMGSSPLNDEMQARIAVQQFYEDGFRHNQYLRRDDTNSRDELTTRAKLRWEPSPTLRLDLAAVFLDIDNGYDVFTVDNSLTTRTDRPGRDEQRTHGGSIVLRHEGARMRFESSTTFAQSDIIYGYDSDWGNDAFWGDYAPNGFTYRNQRKRQTATQDLRWLSTTSSSEDLTWVGGLYVLRLTEDNDEINSSTSLPFGPYEPYAELRSEYEAISTAAYGQLGVPLLDRLTLLTGLRLEHRAADYTDSNGNDFEPSEYSLGGNVSLIRELSNTSNLYVTVSRGFKAGGFNIGTYVPEERRQFDAEYLWNLELGLKARSSDGRFAGDVSVFYSRREQQQVSVSFQADPANPDSFQFYTDNAARGLLYGMESSASYSISPRWRVDARLGLLKSYYSGYNVAGLDLSGRDQAHAPRYNYAAAITWQAPRAWHATLEVEGKAPFYFSADHDHRSRRYALLHARVGYERGQWSVSAWARNLLDKEYSVRGYFFGVAPPDFAPDLYTHRGDPRQAGIALEYRY